MALSALLIAVAALLILAPAASAAVFTVNTTADSLTTDGCDPAPDDCTLREAIEASNATAQIDTVEFAGPVAGTIALEDQIQVGRAVTVVGPGSATLTISGETSSRVFQIDPTVGGDLAGSPVSISGLTMVDGVSGTFGGVIQASSAGLDLDEVVVSGGYAPDGGGGISTGGTNMRLIVTDSSFTGNSTDTDAPSQGGGIRFYGAELSLTRTTMSSNFSWFGGAAISNTPDLTITDSTIAGNDGAFAAGIGLGNTAAGEARIEGSTLSDNQAIAAGGAIELNGLNGSIEIVRSTIADNAALGGPGGGIWFLNGTGSVDVIGSTIAGNEASTQGGGIFTQAAPVGLENTIVADNSAGSAGGGDDLFGEFTAEYSLIEDGAADSTVTDSGGNLFVTDPMLGPLSGNGGPTETMVPGASSPVIDAGIAAGTTEDQRGLPRPTDDSRDDLPGSDGSDMGAVEVQPPVASFTSGPDGRTADTTPTFEFAADGPSPTFECMVDSTDPGDLVSCPASFTTAALVDGDHQISVRATVDGLTGGLTTREFAVDTTGPSAEITGGPGPGSPEPDGDFAFSFESADGDLASFECSLDSDPLLACENPREYTGIPDGDHEFRVRAVDDLGNKGPLVSRAFEIADPATTPDGGIQDLDVTADKKQAQKGSQIKIKVSVGAAEEITAVGSGKVKVKSPSKSYKLKEKTKTIGAGKSKVLKLKLASSKDAKKVRKAIDKWKKAPKKKKSKLVVKAPVKVKGTDEAGDTVTEKRVVTLK